MGLFDFDDPTATAEDRMNAAFAFGCAVIVGIGIALTFIIWVIWRLA